MKETETLKKESLRYHEEGRCGKIEVKPTKPCLTARDLSLAYSPGVANPCLAIAEEGDNVYRYTSKGNLVGVVSNGTAVLGLGNIGPEASKPVMEGKGILFKRFADIDVFDIEINQLTVDGVVDVVKALEPTFGGINLEDIKAPECFEIERQLVEHMDIPVFHDDQHGTAIIASAAFLNALEITKRDIKSTKVVFSGAGAAAIATARLFVSLGVPTHNIIMSDSKGVIYKGRKEGMNQYKEEFAIETKDRTLGDAMKDADAFIGCSMKGVVSKDMVKSMALEPIIFAMANPDPEILPEDVAAVRDDAIMATGRSDYPNQVNNVLGFPYIFRGALDVRARKINIEMKMAAVKALAGLAKEEVTDEVKEAYDFQDFKFGKNYLIPKPFDTRVLTRVTPAVAKAAMDTGVARVNIKNMSEYVLDLEQRLGHSSGFARMMRDKLASKINKIDRKVRVVFTEGANTRVLQAVSVLVDEGHFQPILLGSKGFIEEKLKKLGLDIIDDIEIIKPSKDERYPSFKDEYFKMEQRNGVNRHFAWTMMKRSDYFGSMMVKKGAADVVIGGPSHTYGRCLQPIIKILGKKKEKVAGISVLVFKNKVLLLGDCSAQIDPGANELADIAKAASDLYKRILNKQGNIAFLSFSNFGSSDHPLAKRVKEATRVTKEKYPELVIDGEMQADVAVNKSLMKGLFEFSKLENSADILIFPDLNSANISYKLLNQLAEADGIGPLIAPLDHGANIIPRTSTVNEIVNLTILTSLVTTLE